METELCATTRNYEAVVAAVVWCSRQNLSTELRQADGGEAFLLKIMGVRRPEQRVRVLRQLTEQPGLWHFEDECPPE